MDVLYETNTVTSIITVSLNDFPRNIFSHKPVYFA